MEKWIIVEIDKRILKYIEYNPRFDWTDIFLNIGTNYKTIKKHIKYLENKKITYCEIIKNGK